MKPNLFLAAAQTACCLGYLAWCLALPAAEIDPEVLEAEARRIAAVERAVPSVVAVFARAGQSGGSGVLISPDGFALSNFHVTSEAGPALKCGLPDGRLYDAVIVGLDPTGDVALLKLLGRDDFPFAELGDSDLVRAGDWCFTMGNPFLLATDFQPSVSYGLVSGVHRYQYPAGTILEYADCIQTDAAINPGNSGGPLFDSQGRLIGINGRGSFEKRGRVNVGVGYAISINQIKHFLGSLKSGRLVDHATLGAIVRSDDAGRVIVSDILDTSDAYRRGLRYGDEIVRFAGRPIHTVNAFKNALGIFPQGWRVPLVYQRGGKQYECLVRLEGVHSERELVELVEGPRRQPGPPGPRPEQPEQPDQPPEGAPGEPEAPGNEPSEPEQPGETQDEPAGSGKPKLPEAVKPYYEERPGYVNYYFNRLNQERVWRGLVSQGDLTGTGTWTLAATFDGGQKVRVRLAEDQAELTVAAERVAISSEEDVALVDPPPTRGLVAALHLWRRLLAGGLDRYGEVYYLGTMPLAGQAGLVDCLVGIHGGVECRFLCDPESGRLLGLELFAEEDADPCEVYFSDYREAEGRQLPHRIEVRRGEVVYGGLKLDTFQAEPAAKPQPGKSNEAQTP